jgi:ADP-ribose pyrophosphatase
MSRTVVHVGRKIQVAIEESLGREGALIRRDVVIHPGAVAILPLLGERQVLLVRNHRPNVGETLWEVPAGTLGPGEDPGAAALRELEEETGYRAAQAVKVGEMYPSPGVMTERTHMYVATGLTPGEPRLEPDEEMTAHAVSLDDAVRWAMDGTIRDAKTIVALLWHVLRPPRQH